MRLFPCKLDFKDSIWFQRVLSIIWLFTQILQKRGMFSRFLCNIHVEYSIIDSHRKLSILKIYTRKVCLKDCTSITFLTSPFSCMVQVRICANFYSILSNIPAILSSGLSLKAQRVLAGTSKVGVVRWGWFLVSSAFWWMSMLWIMRVGSWDDRSSCCIKLSKLLKQFRKYSQYSLH